MKNFIDSKGATKDFAIFFVISNDYMKLRIYVDITLFNCYEGDLSTYAVDVFKLWFMHKRLSFCDLYITHPHMWEIKNWKKRKGGV